ncbi:hypothetical protein F2Q69_00031289 [Brassica cretica]|uniref:Uncharacterized protein n=1 Tax=Brassica cretica TaxID=69181 RepID=A0A8S9S8T7_BRACR|nr:hypothetical protein F2Q69_00031289 [Brassica cretica]
MVKETKRMQMDEEMLDNDDLLGDDIDCDAEKIDAISPLSPVNTVSLKDKQIATLQESAPPISTSLASTQSASEPQGSRRSPKGYLKKKTAANIDIKGLQASKKLQVLKTRGSPKKKEVAGKSPTASSKTVPRNEVFPSALRKKSVSLSGSVVSQKSPSKKI